MGFPGLAMLRGVCAGAALLTLVAGCCLAPRSGAPTNPPLGLGILAGTPLPPGSPAVGPVPSPRSMSAELVRKLAEAEERVVADPSDWERWFVLSRIYEDLRALTRSQACYRRMIGLLPPRTYTYPYFQLGRVLWVLGRSSGSRVAESALRECLAVESADCENYKLNAHYRESHYLLAKIFETRGDGAAAEGHYDAFIDLGGSPSRLPRADRGGSEGQLPPGSFGRR